MINDLFEASKDMDFLFFDEETTVFETGTDLNE